jgi:hypothetical protein
MVDAERRGELVVGVAFAAAAIALAVAGDPLPDGSTQGRVVEVRPDEGCRYMDPISYKYTGRPFPQPRQRPCVLRDRGREAAQRTLGFVHDPH